MHRLRSILFYTITCILLLLTLTFLIGWARSYIAPTNLKLQPKSSSTYIRYPDGKEYWRDSFTFTTRGVIGFGAVAGNSRGNLRWYRNKLLQNVWWRASQKPPPWERLGGIDGYREIDEHWRSYWFVVPFWFLTLLPATPLLILAYATLRRERRTRAGICAHCGYDLRESPVRCPECGQAVPSARTREFADRMTEINDEEMEREPWEDESEAQPEEKEEIETGLENPIADE